MLTLTQNIKQITILLDGQIQVLRQDIVLQDGEFFSESLHRHVISPGDKYTGEDVRVQKACKAFHTVQVIADYRAAITLQKAR